MLVMVTFHLLAYRQQKFAMKRVKWLYVIKIVEIILEKYIKDNIYLRSFRIDFA